MSRYSESQVLMLITRSTAYMVMTAQRPYELVSDVVEDAHLIDVVILMR